MKLALEDAQKKGALCSRMADFCGKRGSAKTYTLLADDLAELTSSNLLPTVNICRQWVVEYCQHSLSSGNHESLLRSMRLWLTSDELSAEGDVQFDHDHPVMAHVAPSQEDVDMLDQEPKPKPEVPSELLVWEKDSLQGLGD